MTLHSPPMVNICNRFFQQDNGSFHESRSRNLGVNARSGQINKAAVPSWAAPLIPGPGLLHTGPSALSSSPPESECWQMFRAKRELWRGEKNEGSFSLSLSLARLFLHISTSFSSPFFLDPSACPDSRRSLGHLFWHRQHKSCKRKIRKSPWTYCLWMEPVWSTASMCVTCEPGYN